MILYRDKFDAVAEQLCEEFRILDHLVNSAVMLQVADVFVETAAPMHKLVGAAISPVKRVRDSHREVVQKINNRLIIIN